MISNKITYHRIASGIVALYFIFWLYQGHFLFQLHHPTLINTGIDNTYWLLCILRIPQTIMQFPLLFDLLFVVVSIISFATKNKWSFRFLLIVSIVHIITFNVFTGMHTKSCVFLPMLLLPFCFDKLFDLVWQGVRYYFLFVLVSAAFYKILNGGLFHPNQFVHILENQHAELSILNPTNYTYLLSVWLIQHAAIANMLWYALFVMEAIFLIGFFTRKFDSILLVVLVLFMLSTFILMRISLFDFCCAFPFLFILKNDKKDNSH
ncbi:MAG: hypothetical protein U0U67_09775 [Chitinophagales bacterium]